MKIRSNSSLVLEKSLDSDTADNAGSGDAPHGPPTNSASLDDSRIVLLGEASRLVGVQYHTLVDAHRRDQLAVDCRPDRQNDSVRVEIAELVDYMVHRAPQGQRWMVENIDVAAVEVVPGRQPRLKKSDSMVRNLTDHLRHGGALAPVVVYQLESRLGFELVDGHRRLRAHQLARRSSISAIILPLPSRYADVLAESLNTRHGENLTDGEKQFRVEQHLRRHRQVYDGLRCGEISTKEAGKKLGVSASTVSRAVVAITPKQPVPIDGKRLLLGLGPLLKCLARTKVNYTLAAALVCGRVSSVALAQFESEDKKDTLARLKMGSLPIARFLSPEIRGLLDRRGGDRTPAGQKS